MLVTRLGVFDFTTGLQDGLSGDGEKEGGVREEGGLGRRRESLPDVMYCTQTYV